MLGLCSRGPGHGGWKWKTFRESAHHGANVYQVPRALCPGRQPCRLHTSHVTALAQAPLGGSETETKGRREDVFA